MPAPTENLSVITKARRTRDVTFGSVQYEPKGDCGPRIQQDFQLVAVHTGEARITVDDEEHELPPGSIALMKPGHRELFEFSRTTKTFHTWCSIAPNQVTDEVVSQIDSCPFQLPITPRIQTLIDLGLSSPESDLPATSALIDSLALALLHEYLAQAVLGKSSRSNIPPAITRAKALIEQELASELSLSVLASAAFCSPNHLTRLFRTHLETTPMRYVWDRRAERGAELLRQTGLSISEIAERTGFQSPFHFSRLIRERYGHSPKHLRDLYWNAK